jgi:SAM-dependent methyltransferase
MPAKDLVWAHLKDLPYFRAMLRSVEASYYQEYPLVKPVLDLGCGDGHFASRTFDHPLDCGLDPWTGPILRARETGAYDNLVQADGGKMPFPDCHFGSGLSNSVLEHIPDIDAVLAETGRVLQPGAPFVFSVPNPRYLSELSISGTLQGLGLKGLGKSYTDWFKQMSRVHHADWPEVWQTRLEKAGFQVDTWWHYFSPSALRAMEWGHYFGAPTLLSKALFHRWIVAPHRWNLALTERYVRRYTDPNPVPDGTFTFYITTKT